MIQEHRTNLAILARRIRKIPQEMFTMEHFRTPSGKASQPENRTRECTVPGCVLGHAPAFFPKKSLPRYTFDNASEADPVGTIWFLKFAADTFGLFPGGRDFNWLFWGSWHKVDNTPEGAARRIEWLLEHGTPTNAWEQSMGLEPLCYI